jgi:uncharacterized membrane protein
MYIFEFSATPDISVAIFQQSAVQIGSNLSAGGKDALTTTLKMDQVVRRLSVEVLLSFRSFFACFPGYRA